MIGSSMVDGYVEEMMKKAPAKKREPLCMVSWNF